MKKFLSVILLALGIIFGSQIINVSTASAADVDIAYWNGDKNCPIWVERNDGSKIVFKLNMRHIIIKVNDFRRVSIFS